jgi:hypothetical protein
MSLLQECRRHYALSPSHFLQFVQQFGRVRGRLAEESSRQLDRYRTGKRKVLEAQVNSLFMKVLLRELRPLLAEKRLSMERMLAELD